MLHVLSRARLLVSSTRINAASQHVRAAHDGFAGLNFYKDPSKAPQEQEDSVYPSWLWRIPQQKQTREELIRVAELLFAKGGYDAVFDTMSEDDMRRLFKLEQRERIKMDNLRRRGGQVV